MKIEVKNLKETEIAIVNSDEVIITDSGSALDFMATVRYETGCSRIALNKSAIAENFFDLSTRLAGEVTQKFVNYHVIFAIVGDFSNYTSKSLKDFIYESNNGRHLFFCATDEEAVTKLSSV